MSYKREFFKVVISCPNDVEEEKKCLKEIINDANEILKDKGIGFDIYTWDVDANLGFHPLGPQGVIDEALKIYEADIFFGLFYLRFGTPTHDSQSGTEHEIKQAIQSYNENGSPIIKMCFKKNYEVDISKMSIEDFKQFDQVRKFKGEIFKYGISFEFKDLNEFWRKVNKEIHDFAYRKVIEISKKESKNND